MKIEGERTFGVTDTQQSKQADRVPAGRDQARTTAGSTDDRVQVSADARLFGAAVAAADQARTFARTSSNGHVRSSKPARSATTRRAWPTGSSTACCRDARRLMPDVSSLERSLRQVHERRAALADALGRVDVERIEAVGRDLVDVVTRLRTSTARDVSAPGDELAFASEGVQWQVERCRRLGWAFTRPPDLAVPAYEPHGRSRRVHTRVPTIQVLG